MTHRRLVQVCASLVLVLLLSGCHDSKGTPQPVTTVSATPTTTYTDPTRLVTAVSRHVIPCKPLGRPDSTLYSDRSLYCDYEAADGNDEQMIAATFTTAEQEESAVTYFTCPGTPQPGMGVVAGNGWMIAVSPHLGDRVAAALGGRFVHQRAECS